MPLGSPWPTCSATPTPTTNPQTCGPLLLGGFHGAWIPGALTAQACLPRESLNLLGATPGAGVVHVLGAGECGLRRSADIATYLAQQSAGQCGPCLNGLPALAETLTELAYRRPQPNAVREATRMVALVDGRGACKHPDGTARFIRSALHTFTHDIALHRRGRCEAILPAPRPAPRNQ